MSCLCGATHADCVTQLAISHEPNDGAVPRWDAVLNRWLKESGYRSVLLVSDVNTAFAAHMVQSALCVPHVRTYIYDDPLLVPDEYAVQRLLHAATSAVTDAVTDATANATANTAANATADAAANATADAAANSTVNAAYDALLSVGAGTLNDLTRYVSYKLGLPYYVVATAASMDGYTSSVAPLIINGLKVTIPAHAPLGVVGDELFLASSPAEMTAAGYGDMVGKWTSLNDWELEDIFTTAANATANITVNTTTNTPCTPTPYNPYAPGRFCPVLAGYMRRVTADCMDCGPNDRLFMLRGLLESGLVMQRAGHSKPASGSEHHLSHFWEMQALLQGRTPALHGAKVGVATLMALRVNKWLLEESADFSRAYRLAEYFDVDAWRREIHRVFGCAADGVLRQWPHESVAAKKHTLDVIQSQWDTIQAVISRNLPDFADVESGLKRAGAPLTAYEIGVSRDDIINGVLHAQRIRSRFTVWRIADALGRLPEYAERLALSAD